MDAKYYRFLFHNTKDAIFYTGSLWNTYENERFHFLYISAVTVEQDIKSNYEPKFIKDTHPLDALILSDFNCRYLDLTIRILYSRPVRKIVLPYFHPVERALLLEQFMQQGNCTDDVKLFLQNPYRYLLDRGVEQIYMLKGNGPVYNGESCMDGEYFRKLEKNTFEDVPVYYAGYMMRCGWLLYFGNYGEGLDSTIVLYNGSVAEDPEEEDCTLNVKAFSDMQNCCPYMQSKEYSCELICNYRNDFDCLKKHNRKNHKSYINGTLLLGNMKISGQVEKLYQRFNVVKEKIRFIGIPGGGSKKCWDRRILGFGREHYKKYWISPSSEATSADTIRDISISSPYNHFMMTDEYFGVCMTGFLKYRSDIVLPELNK